MLILGLGIEGVAGVGSDLPRRRLVIGKLVSDIVIGSFGSLLAEAIDHSHLLRDKLLGFGVSGGSAE